MRKVKRMIALLTVVMFILSFAAPAAAATKEEAFSRLKALGVAVGDDTGNPLYDKTFTRAEAAAIMVNLKGMNAAISAAKGPTKFKDVPASHWATGVINLAVGTGIIAGYPDGTYKPDQEVSYAELCAMLVGVLNYTSKLQGTWPSNVIGKAAQLGLLDGLNVTDYNAAAVRSNVFLAADEATTVKPLKETTDGWVEDDKSLMEKTLTVKKYAKATVIGTPYYTGLDNKKITIDTDGDAETTGDQTTLTLIDTINGNDFYGLQVEAWEKDDKVFFLNVKTSSSDVKVDTLDKIKDAAADDFIQIGATDAAAGDNDGNKRSAKADVTGIKLKAANSTITTDTNTIWKLNFANVADDNELGLEASIKVIVDGSGKAKYVLSTSKKNAVVDSTNATDNKITADSETVWSGSNVVELKDKKVFMTKNGAVTTLADIKKGDVISYIDSGNNRFVDVSDKTKTGKLESVLDTGDYKVKAAGSVIVDKFTLKLGTEDVACAKYVFISSDNGDTFTKVAAIGDFSTVLGKDVTVKLDAAGKAAYVIAGSAAADNEIPVVVKYIKKVDGAVTSRYLYVAKFDGTETYYEVTKDTKIGSTKIDENALKKTGDYTGEEGPRILITGDEIKVGDIVKLTLTSDNKVNTIKRFTGSSISVQTGDDFSTNKDNSTITVTGNNAVAITSDTKALRVKTALANAALDSYADDISDLDAALLQDLEDKVIDDVDTVSVTALKAIGAPAGTQNVRVIKESGIAKYVVIYDTGVSVASDTMVGVVTAKGVNVDGDDILTIAYNGKTETFVNNDGDGAVDNVVSFRLDASNELSTVDVQNADDLTIGGNVYSYFQLEEVKASDKLLKLEGSGATWTESGNKDYFTYSSSAQFFDVDVSPTIEITDFANAVGDFVQVYDLFDSNGNFTTDGDGVIDLVLVVHNG